MDKAPFQNEETSQVEPNKTESNNAVIVETKPIDVLSLPQKNVEGNEEPPSSDNQPLDENWLLISKDWQSQPVPKTDIEQLLKRTRRRTNGAKTCFALNVIATLGLLIAFVYGSLSGQLGKPMNTYLGIGGLLSLVMVYYEMKIRLSAWKGLCDSPQKAIEHAITGCKSSMQYMMLTKASTVPFFFLMNWFIYTVGKTSDKPVLVAFIFANGFVVGVYIIADYLHQKRKKEYQQLLALKTE